jgi:hypothetical protein
MPSLSYRAEQRFEKSVPLNVDLFAAPRHPSGKFARRRRRYVSCHTGANVNFSMENSASIPRLLKTRTYPAHKQATPLKSNYINKIRSAAVRRFDLEAGLPHHQRSFEARHPPTSELNRSLRWIELGSTLGKRKFSIEVVVGAPAFNIVLSQGYYPFSIRSSSLSTPSAGSPRSVPLFGDPARCGLSKRRKEDSMTEIVGVALRVDLNDLKTLNVLVDPPVLLGRRATKAAIQPRLTTENIRAFVLPVYRGQREEMFAQIFEQFEMKFDPNIVEEVWNIPSRLRRLEECRTIIVIGHESSTVYYTKPAFGPR